MKFCENDHCLLKYAYYAVVIYDNDNDNDNEIYFQFVQIIII